MFKAFFNFLVTAKLRQIDLFDNLELAKTYNKVVDNTDSIFVRHAENQFTLLTPGDEGPECPMFIKVDNENTCAIHKNLLFSFMYDPEMNDRILRIYVKKPEDNWIFNKNVSGVGCDVLKPINVHAEVYVNYSVSVLKLNRCVGDNYKSGHWNKMFYLSLEDFIQKTCGFTEINQINEAYERRK